MGKVSPQLMRAVGGKKAKNPSKAIIAGGLSGALEACISYVRRWGAP